MSVDLFADSTMHYRYTGSGLNYVGLKWTTASGAETSVFPDGSSRPCLRFTANGGQLNKTMTYQNSWWVGFRVYIQGDLGNFGNVYNITHAGEATLGSVTIEHDQTLSIRAGSDSGTVLFNTGSLSSPVTIQGNTMYYIEIGVVTSGGSVSTPIVIAMSLIVNGVQMGTGFYSGNSPYNTSQTLNGTNMVNDHVFNAFGTDDGFSYFRDFYISDSTNAPYGDINLGVIFPYSNVVTDFTGVGASPNYNCVNDLYPDINDDTIYIEDNNPGDKESYLFGPLSGTTPIPFVHYCVFHKKDAEGTRTFDLTINGTDESPAPISPGDDYRYNCQGFDEPPGGGAWTVTTFNATNFGVDIKT